LDRVSDGRGRVEGARRGRGDAVILPDGAEARFQNPDTIRKILGYTRAVAIVGLSSNPLRASNFVGFYLRLHGYPVYAVNPREREVFGAPAYTRLGDVPGPFEVVVVVRTRRLVPAI